ncbi:K(+) efflux antiporter 6 [Diplonema papillatum]|nr:K(+) efflux antiporter 6 [Diplonema papillatum]
MRKRKRDCARGCFSMVCVSLFYVTIVTLTVAPGPGADASKAVDDDRRSAPVAKSAKKLTAQLSDKAFNKKFAKDMKTLRNILSAKHKLDQLFNEQSEVRGQDSSGIHLEDFSDTAETTAPGTTAVLRPDEILRRKRKLGQRILNELESGIMEKAMQLSDLMKNLTDGVLKTRLQDRLEDLQGKSVQAKDDYDELIFLEKEEAEATKRQQEEARNGDSNEGGVDQLMGVVDHELGMAISELRNELTHSGTAWSRARGAEHVLETVIKVLPKSVSSPSSARLRHSDAADPSADHHLAGAVSTLIDHEDNVYVLSLPHDASAHYEDKTLLADFMALTVVSFALAYAARAARIPLFFGFIAAGTLLAPSELNFVRNLVQVETLAQLGVCFMLLLLGSEFSLDKLKRVWKTAVIGGVIMMAVVTVLSTLTLEYVFRASRAEGIVLGFCFSLSSTAVALKCVTSSNACETWYARVLLGVLVVQDVALGLMVATIPLLTPQTEVGAVEAVAQMCLGLLVLLVSCHVFGRWVAIPVIRRIKDERELLLLGFLSCCFVVVWLSEILGLGMEVASFCIGLSFASDVETQQLLHETVQPLQDFFVTLFFASIGFHVYPTFLVRELALLASLTLLVVGLKYFVGLLVFHLVCRADFFEASLIALGLSQMSEFSFVVAAHGKAYGLISNEVYFVLLGTTSLSLTTTPLLWSLHDKEDPT